jgi:hypothetical protein
MRQGVLYSFLYIFIFQLYVESAHRTAFGETHYVRERPTTAVP